MNIDVRDFISHVARSHPLWQISGHPMFKKKQKQKKKALKEPFNES